jgi:hypothetical protein
VCQSYSYTPTVSAPSCPTTCGSCSTVPVCMLPNTKLEAKNG